jgi:nitroreductase/FMN reductase [NAD(P)H]
VAPLLGLPKGVFPVAGLTLGFPDAREASSPRLPPSVVVHRGRYSNEAEAEAIMAYDARRRPRQAALSRRSTDLRRMAADGARMSQGSLPCRSAPAFAPGCARAASRLTEGDDNPGGADAAGQRPPRPVRPRHAASLICGGTAAGDLKC